MEYVKNIERAALPIRTALNNLMYKYDHTPRQMGEKHKLYRSIILLQEGLSKLEPCKQNTLHSMQR